MEFKVGEVVVYPHHGAARIADIEHREMVARPWVLGAPDQSV